MSFGLERTSSRVKDLPLAAGVSKQAVSLSMTWLENEGYITVGSDANARGEVVALPPKGVDGRDAYASRRDDVERYWAERFGADVLHALRELLQSILEEPGGDDGPLSSGLATPPGEWRASAATSR
jgi:hypothetical protein